MRNNSLKVTWLDSDATKAQTPSPSHLCLLGPNNGRMLESGQNKQSWLCATLDLPKAGVPFGGLRAYASPSQYSSALIVTLCCHLSVSSQSCDIEIAFGDPETGGKEWGTALTGAVFSSATAPPPFVSCLNIGSASCRNFSPSGWQLPQVPAWGSWQP